MTATKKRNLLLALLLLLLIVVAVFVWQFFFSDNHSIKENTPQNRDIKGTGDCVL
jgi:hypothetical protein